MSTERRWTVYRRDDNSRQGCRTSLRTAAPAAPPVTDPILRPVAWTLKHTSDRIAVQELHYIGQIVQAELLRRSEAAARA